MRTTDAFTAAIAFALVSCGGSTPPPTTADGSNKRVTAAQVHTCGEADKVQAYDLHDEDGQDAFVPCSHSGAHDYSGLVHIETTPDGVRISIKATDDEVNAGVLGSDVKSRDAVIVFPKGPGSKAVEVPLTKTASGYAGEKMVGWDDLGKITDEGTKIDVAVFDHDSTNGAPAEEMHVSVAVSAGKSCEKAVDENPQTLDMSGAKGGRDLTDAELGGPMKSSAFFSSCGLANSANAKICVAVKQGRPLGVSVEVSPQNRKMAACIDKATRKLGFPKSDKLDVVHQSF